VSSNGIFPYWRLSGYYLCYFGALGAFVPYWPVYLKFLGLTPAQIGELVGVSMAMRIIAPYWWGWFSDHYGTRMPIVRWTSLLAMISFWSLFFSTSYEWIFLCISVYSFFWNAGLPQFEAVTLAYLHGRTYFYSRIRLWGSIGFILAVIALGIALEDHDPPLLLWALSGLYGGIWLLSLSVPDKASIHPQQHTDSFWAVLRRPVVLMILGGCFLMQFSHGPYYTFYSIYLQQHGYRASLIGQLWALGVIAEVGVFLIMDKLLHRFNLRTLMSVSLGLATLRWLLLGHLAYMPVAVMGGQLLHAATFGVFHAVSIQWIYQLFPGRLQGRGMALYSSLSFGLGSALGALVSGYTWESLGPLHSFNMAALSASIGAWLVWRLPAKSVHFLPTQ